MLTKVVKLKSQINTPKISIIIPTLNRSHLLKQTLISVQKQTFQNWEALVVDDGSTDDTQEKILLMSQADPRICYMRRRSQKSGAPICRNEGTSTSKGEYIIYLDSDDCLSPTALENRIKEMERHPELDFGVFPGVLFQERPGDMRLLFNIDTGVNDIDRFLALDIPWQTTSPIWRRNAILRLGPWQENLLSWQDWEYHLRALILNFRYEWFSSPDFFWRVEQKKSKKFWSTDQRMTIGAQSRSSEHLKGHEQLFLQIEKMLLCSGLLTDKRKDLLLGLHSWLAQSWVFNGDKEKSLQIWKFCYEKGWINHKFYLEGRWYLKNIAQLRGIRRIVKKYQEISFQKEIWLYFPHSPTFRKSPIPLLSLSDIFY